MTAPAAVDLVPLAQVLLVGAALSSIVVGWVWLRARGQSGQARQLAATGGAPGAPEVEERHPAGERGWRRGEIG